MIVKRAQSRSGIVWRRARPDPRNRQSDDTFPKSFAVWNASDNQLGGPLAQAFVIRDETDNVVGTTRYSPPRVCGRNTVHCGEYAGGISGVSPALQPDPKQSHTDVVRIPLGPCVYEHPRQGLTQFGRLRECRRVRYPFISPTTLWSSIFMEVPHPKLHESDAVHDRRSLRLTGVTPNGIGVRRWRECAMGSSASNEPSGPTSADFHHANSPLRPTQTHLDSAGGTLWVFAGDILYGRPEICTLWLGWDE